MTIDLEKILRITLKEWFETNNKKPEDYIIKGVNVSTERKNILEEFRKEAPPEAEIVVDYEVKTYRGISYASGLALIPKNS